MFLAKMDSTKALMHQLLKEKTFHPFLLREATVTTFVTYTIDGQINGDFLEEEVEEGYCLWSQMQEQVLQWVKGKKLPKQMKLIFAAPKRLKEKVAPQASVLFLNVIFEQGEVRVVTGTSMATFTLNKDADRAWDEWVQGYLKKQGLQFETIA